MTSATSATSESYDNTIVEFPLTEEIKELGISRVYTGISDNSKTPILFVERTGIESNPLQCRYDKSSFKKTAKELESVLTAAGHNVKHARKFIVHLSKIWIDMERQRQKTYRDHILEEIRERRKNTKFASVEQWQMRLVEQYKKLQEVVKSNIPEIETGLEFELCITYSKYFGL